MTWFNIHDKEKEIELLCESFKFPPIMLQTILGFCDSVANCRYSEPQQKYIQLTIENGAK